MADDFIWNSCTSFRKFLTLSVASIGTPEILAVILSVLEIWFSVNHRSSHDSTSASQLPQCAQNHRQMAKSSVKMSKRHIYSRSERYFCTTFSGGISAAHMTETSLGSHVLRFMRWKNHVIQTRRPAHLSGSKWVPSCVRCVVQNKSLFYRTAPSSIAKRRSFKAEKSFALRLSQRSLELLCFPLDLRTKQMA